jgi:arsenite-transporting ATPase
VRFHFFGGKGGVGKTTCAAAHAVRACDQGARVLVVSMDPAHSLGDALAKPLGPKPMPVRVGSRRMHALELDADGALRRWLREREDSLRTVAERGTLLDDADVDRLIGLGIPGTDELVGLIELRRVAREGRWDTVVVDTAPTGHAMRLLQTPYALARIAHVLDEMQAKHRLLAESISGGYRPDEADRMIFEIAEDAEGLKHMLGDGGQCSATWVLLPEALSIEETSDALRDLDGLGVTVERLLINRVTPRPTKPCPQCTPRVEAERAAIAQARDRFRGNELALVAAADEEPRGVAALRSLGEREIATTPRRHKRKRGIEQEDGKTGSRELIGAQSKTFPSSSLPVRSLSPLASWRRGDLSLPEVLEGRRLILFGGKGGVGKTTCAAATAIALAHASRRVLLLSTDPAHSVSDVLGVSIGDAERKVPGVAGLYARELDAEAAFAVERERYRAAIDTMFRALVRSPRFDATYDRVVMEDLIDLAPPGIDEVFAVVTLVEALDREEKQRVWDSVVVDTAPTGHTLRLLAMPSMAREWTHALLAVLLKYRRVLGLGELASDLLTFARRLKALDELLHDESRAAFVAVTRAADLPLLETERLLAELVRLRVPCPAVVVDAATFGTCPRCRRNAAVEADHLAALVRASRASRRARSSARRERAILVAPAVYPPPRGVASLARWAARWGKSHDPKSAATT